MVLFGSFLMLRDFHDETCVALANLPRSINYTWSKNETVLDVVMVIECACLLIPSLNKHVLPIVVFTTISNVQ